MLRKVIRVDRKDSAFVYAILESLEGLVSFSTLPPDSGSATFAQVHRDLELFYSPEFEADVEHILEGFRKRFPVIEFGAPLAQRQME